MAFPTSDQDRAVRVADALAAGVSKKTLRSTRQWRAPLHGVRVPTDATEDGLLSECRSLAVALDAGVAFSHTTALRLHGIEVPWRLTADDRLHVVTDRAADRPERPEVVSHWSRQSFLDVMEVDGLPVTTPAQTWVHVACGLRVPDDVVVLGDAMMRRKRTVTSRAELADLAGRTFKVKGIVQAREQIERMRPGTDSSMETRTRLILTDAGLPCPVVNEVVTAPDGTYVKRVDMLYRQWRVAIEYDGDHHRTDQAQWRDDVRRRRMLETLGWSVIVVVADDVLQDPAGFLARVRTAIHAARNRAL